LPMRREIVNSSFARYGLVANLSVNKQNLGVLVHTETPLMFFVSNFFYSYEYCLESVYGCFFCYEGECNVTRRSTEVTFRDGLTISVLVSTGSLDISEQDRPIISFGSLLNFIHGSVERVPSSVLGLGFPQNRPLFRTPLINQLVRDPSGYIKSRSFSLYLESGSLTRGEVLLGGVDPDKFIGPLALMPVFGEGHWMLHVLAVYVGGGSRRQAGLHVVLDTGTNGIYTPAKAREDLITLIKAGVEKPIDIRLNGGVYEVDCVDRNYLPTIQLSLEGVGGKVSMEVPQENYVEELASSGACTLLFLENTEGFWRLGQNVVPGNYFSFDFDKKQIGIAK
ncbi:hypothetical protein FOZ62_009055, partial [Perkinsus olseni]